MDPTIEEKLERLRILEEKQLRARESVIRSKQRPEFKEVKKRNSADYYQRHKEELKERRLQRENKFFQENNSPKETVF
jgi:hypothetical protein